MSLTVTPDISLLEVSLDENIRLSVNDLEWLSPFINFCEEE